MNPKQGLSLVDYENSSPSSSDYFVDEDDSPVHANDAEPGSCDYFGFFHQSSDVTEIKEDESVKNLEDEHSDEVNLSMSLPGKEERNICDRRLPIFMSDVECTVQHCGYENPHEQMFSYGYPDQPNFKELNKSSFTETNTEVVSKVRRLGNEEVIDLIKKYEVDPYGMQMPDNIEIIDVRGDDQVGSSKQNVLRGLSLAKPAVSIGKTDSKKPNITAKRKHQITYLAHLATEREEQLQQQWALNRQHRQDARRKYGF
ncbi:Proline-rich protein PRCC [Trichinella pseudospiralis]|uniref:Proline-rich protein PRCC n=1 Tax=Trichinella pseudospiralis TaxID=6337 RepID=A0A0V0YEC8_TRIPS|nr:Proline-rich protein PRCC [Trichinella pseudospiralis]